MESRVDRGSLGFCLMMGALLVGLYLPFIDKAFHIDDYYVLAFSQMLGFNPLHAEATEYYYMGGQTSGFTPYQDNSPLLIPYVVKLLSAVFGASERALHTAFLVFPAISLASLVWLNRTLFPAATNAQREVSRTIPLFILSAPAFMVNSQNLMRDVPALSFLLLALASFAAYIERGRVPMALLGGGSLALAILTQYPPLAFVPVIAVYALLRKKLNVWMGLGLLLPLAVLFGLLTASYGLLDKLAQVKEGGLEAQHSLWWLADPGRFWGELPAKVMSLLAHLGASTVFVTLAHLCLRRPRPYQLSVLGLFALFAYVVSGEVSDYGIPSRVLLAAASAAGAFALCETTIRALARVGGRRSPGEAFLLLWVFTMAVCLVVLFPLGSARYILPLLPPVVLVMLNAPLPAAELRRPQRVVLYACLGSSLLFGVASAYSDYEHADDYRRFAADVKRIKESATEPFDVWYISEWGMRHYMDEAGARYLPSYSNEPREGDVVVMTGMSRHWGPSPLIADRLQLFDHREYDSAFPLRLFHTPSNAGFYGHYWGLLPFSFSRLPHEVFDIYVVSDRAPNVYR